MSGGVLGSALANRGRAVDANDYRRGVCEAWFESGASLVAHGLMQRVEFPSSWGDSLTARGIMVMASFGLVKGVTRCPKCGKGAVLRRHATGRFCWWCATGGRAHFMQSLNSVGALTEIRVSNWFPFLHCITLLRLGQNWSFILKELGAGYGVGSHHTPVAWRRFYQTALKNYLLDTDGMMLGGKDEVVVLDETNLGAQKGIAKGPQKPRSMSNSKPVVRKRILKREPARTIWRKTSGKQAAKKVLKAMKTRKAARPLMKAKAKDARAHGRWLWAAVVVGKNKECWTHGNGKKRFTFMLLPPAASAPRGKPRGLDSITQTLRLRVHPKSFLVFDKWRSTVGAVKRLGYKHADPIVHGREFRDRDTGFHSNDIESEFNRFKRWVRQRYGQLTAGGDASHEEFADLDLYEYTFYINVGDSMEAVMKALAHSQGGAYRPFTV